MRLLDGELILSPSDLTGFSACAHLTHLNSLVAAGKLERPRRNDPLLDVLSRLGGEHEAKLLAELAAGGRTMADIAPITKTRADLEAAATATEDAMREGVDVIYQATFFHDGWVGHADYLTWVETPSPNLGAWSYEVADAKLARSVKAAALVQVCAYSDHVERIQGVPPDHVHVLTGDGETHTYRLASLAAYYRALRSRLAGALAGSDGDTYPEPVDHCRICRWGAQCARQRRADDHLSLVAGMRRDQTRHLVAAGITSRAALAGMEPGTDTLSISAAALERLRAQAALQVKGDGAATPLWELLEPEVPDEEGPEKGFAALPEPSPGDVFLDLESDPYALDGGLEYLFGIVEVVDGAPVYHRFWAHTRAEERLAFEQAIDLITDRLGKDPNAHVYHYAPYERTAISRLMGLHGTRESEVDALLRSEALVDLYQVVRQSMRLSTESYSLKQVERCYFTREATEVMDAGSSIVTYEQWLVDGEQRLLDEIAAYNEEDCLSLVGLQEWLEQRRAEAEDAFGPIPRPAVRDGAPPEELTEHEQYLDDLTDRLRDGIPTEEAARSEEESACWLLGDLLQWHRREAKPGWWLFFHRVRDMVDEDFVDDPDCIGGLTYEGVVGTVKKSEIHRYRFEPQDHKIRRGQYSYDPATEDSAGFVMGVDDAEGTIDLRRGATSQVPHPRSLIPCPPLRDREQRDALIELAEWVAEHGVDAEGEWRAGRDLLLARSPRVFNRREGTTLAGPEETPLEAARRLVPQLASSCLAVQGPPGAGKTFTGAHVILDLIKAGKRVGVTALSHAAISTLLKEIAKVALDRGDTFVGIQRCEELEHCDVDHIERATDNDRVLTALQDGQVKLAAGTAWLWARQDMRHSVDFLFVDEAGQLSLANVLAVSGAAESLVLLGDPQQLAQPSQASHPDGAGASALEHVLGDHQTIPPERGLFLDATYRMHPAITAFISEVVYESRLVSAPDRENQAVGGVSGLEFVAVDHVGNRTSSPEEAKAIAALIGSLLGRTWRDHEKRSAPLELDQIMVVAPYNAQVACLRRHLPDGARIGTVDKFQGQEAPVSIYSMATSTPEDAPRGMSFLYDLHRFNVAVSRARAVSVVVGSPALLKVLCTTAGQVPLANALCRFVEMDTLSEGR
ncbi:MAG: TM0106 family RecB-like putative nuclease [Actinobacteria bacterium]|nr:TM0106 family RecB-like putative nuclease [Actinomycetota bacterium]